MNLAIPTLKNKYCPNQKTEGSGGKEKSIVWGSHKSALLCKHLLKQVCRHRERYYALKHCSTIGKRNGMFMLRTPNISQFAVTLGTPGSWFAC